MWKQGDWRQTSFSQQDMHSHNGTACPRLPTFDTAFDKVNLIKSSTVAAFWLTQGRRWLYSFTIPLDDHERKRARAFTRHAFQEPSACLRLELTEQGHDYRTFADPKSCPKSGP